MENGVQVNNLRKQRPAIYLTIIVYFFWGFAAAGNALLIPIFKSTFNLTQFQAQLVELSFYMAYFLGSIVYFLISMKFGDISRVIGAKKGMIFGLTLSAIGSLLMIPAANFASYSLFLTGLFVIGLGFTLQQIVANPLLVRLGNGKEGANNLMVAGSINSFGNTISPLILSVMIFGSIKELVHVNISSVKMPYLILTGCYLFFGFLYALIAIPESKKSSMVDKVKFGAFSFPQVRWGMLAILCYVGGEVTIQSNLPALIKSKDIMGLDANNAVHLFTLFGGSLMIGRCAATVGNFKLRTPIYYFLLVLVSFLAFGVLLLVNLIKGSPMNDLYTYMPFILLIIICIALGNRKESSLLFWSALSAILMLGLGLALSGKWAMYCIISAAFFCSLMWPCIFALSIKGLKEHTGQASSLLVMMIVGGAIIPPLQGLLSDSPLIGIHYSYFVPTLCFLYILWFSVKIKKYLLPTE